MKHSSNIRVREKSYRSSSRLVKLNINTPVAAQTPAAPSEETIIRLNEIVKQAPFCFYYREKEHDLL